MSSRLTAGQIVERTRSRLRPDEKLDTEPSSSIPDGFNGEFRIGSTVDFKSTRTVYRLQVLGFIRPSSGSYMSRLNRTRCLLSNGRVAHPSILFKINQARIAVTPPIEEVEQA